MDTELWGVVLVFIVFILMLFSTFINQSNNDHNFDADCIKNDHSLTYITLQGADYSKKVCLNK